MLELVDYQLLTKTFSNNHIQDVLMVSYLANTVRTQVELSNRLATAALTLGGGDVLGGNAGGENATKTGQDQRRGKPRGQQTRINDQ